MSSYEFLRGIAFEKSGGGVGGLKEDSYIRPLKERENGVYKYL